MDARKALIVTEYYPPAPGPATARIAGFVRHLPDYGWTPLVVTPLATRMAGLGPSVAAMGSPQRAVAQAPGRRPLPEPRVIRAAASLPTPLVRIIDHLFLAGTHLPLSCRPPLADGGTIDWFFSAFLTVLRVAGRERPDVIYATAPPVTGHFAAALAARRLRVPLVLDFRDLWRDNPGYVGAPAVGALHRRCERWLLSAAAGVVVNTPGAQRLLCERYAGLAGLEEKLWVIPNGFNPEDFPAPPPSTGGVDGLEEGTPAGPPVPRSAERSPFRLCFVGKLYGDFGLNYWDAELARRRRLAGWKPPRGSDRLPEELACLNPAGVLEAVRDLLDAGELGPHELRVAFIGNHGDGNARLAAALGLQEVVTFQRTVEPESALDAVRDADALLLLSSGAAHVVPAKTYEYLAAGKPLLVVAPPGDLEQLLERSGVDWFGARPNGCVSIRTALAGLIAFLRRGTAPRPALPGFLAGYERRGQAGTLAKVFDAASVSSINPSPSAVPALDASPHATDRQQWSAPALRPSTTNGGETASSPPEPAEAVDPVETASEGEPGRTP
jgi:glycosyltransferase involved in cell wall biosynthesis